MDCIKFFIEKGLYPIMEAARGNHVREYFREFTAHDRFSYEQLREIQRDKLSRLLLHCIENVPAYKWCGVSRQQILDDPFDALSKFPVLTKNDFRISSDSYISKITDRAALIPNISGGSTGEPVRFYMDRPTVEHYEAARFAGMARFRISFGSRSVMIWGNPIELDANKSKKYMRREKYLKNRIMIPAYSLSPAKIKEYVKTISDYRPEYIYGYSSSLTAFAELMLANGLRLRRLKAVISTSETLFDYQRETIEKAFRCCVVNEYGARDGGILGYECPCGRMHIPMENVIVESLDPQTLKPVADGSEGLAVSTDLNNYSMPRLRYEIGDVITLGSTECECGRGSKIIASVSGREDALLVRADGALVHGHAISHMARSRDIMQFQLVQQSPDKCVLYAVEGKNSDDDLNAFAHEISEFLGGIAVNIEKRDKLTVSKSGKFRYTIREFELNTDKKQ